MMKYFRQYSTPMLLKPVCHILRSSGSQTVITAVRSCSALIFYLMGLCYYVLVILVLLVQLYSFFTFFCICYVLRFISSKFSILMLYCSVTLVI
jgi:hypothetical protein